MESLEELQEIERQCVSKFRQKAGEIRAAHPELTAQVAYARAIQALPKTCDKYQAARQRLMFAGYPALPLR